MRSLIARYAEHKTDNWSKGKFNTLGTGKHALVRRGHNVRRMISVLLHLTYERSGCRRQRSVEPQAVQMIHRLRN